MSKCGCDFNSCGDLRHMCASCSAKVAASYRAEEAAKRAEAAANRIEKNDRARRVGEAVLRSLAPMDESEELTRADRIDLIATSYGDESWTHYILRAIAEALRGEP